MIVNGAHVKSQQTGVSVLTLDGLEGELKLRNHEMLFVATTNRAPDTVFSCRVQGRVVDFGTGVSTEERQRLREHMEAAVGRGSSRPELRLEATLTLVAAAAELERGQMPSLSAFPSTNDFKVKPPEHISKRNELAKKFINDNYIRITDDNMHFGPTKSESDYKFIRDVCKAVNDSLPNGAPRFTYTGVKGNGDFIEFLRSIDIEPIEEVQVYPVTEGGKLVKDIKKRRKMSDVVRLHKKARRVAPGNKLLPCRTSADIRSFIRPSNNTT